MLHTNFDFEEFDLNYELIHWLISKINRIDNANIRFFSDMDPKVHLAPRALQTNKSLVDISAVTRRVLSIAD